MELIDKNVIRGRIIQLQKLYENISHDYSRGVIDCCFEFEKLIEENTTTDGSVHAKWINKKGKLKCSVCDCYAKWSSDDGGWWSMDDSKYCPNCGAKMDL